MANVLRNFALGKPLRRMNPRDMQNLHQLNALYLRDLMIARMRQQRQTGRPGRNLAGAAMRRPFLPFGPMRPQHPAMRRGPGVRHPMRRPVPRQIGKAKM